MQQIKIKPGFVSKEQIPKILEERGVRINRYAEVFFSHPRFSADRAEAFTVTVASLREIGFEDGATLAEIFPRLPQLGLKPCSAGTGLLLRLAWADQPKSRNAILSGTHEAPDRAVTVLSEFLEQRDDFPKGLYLRNVEGVLWLRGFLCDAGYRFPGEALFALESAE